MISWCCAYVHEYCERKAERSLNERGFETFVPGFIEERVVRHKLRQERALLFPGYVFVGLDLSNGSWRRAAYAKGVAYLLGSNGERFVRWVQRCLSDVGRNARDAAALTVRS